MTTIINRDHLIELGARARLAEIEKKRAALDAERDALLDAFPNVRLALFPNVAPAPAESKKSAPVKRAPKKAAAPLTGRMKEVAMLVRKVEKITADKVADKLGITHSHANTLLSAARVAGIVERIETGVYKGVAS